jgi:hypothetical protein
LPGGFGTLDEGMEVLTLLQTGKRDMVPVVFLDEPGGDFWSDFHRLLQEKLVDRGLISPEDLSLYKLTDSVDEAVGEILQFFRVYDSMRQVRQRLVIRLREPPDSATLEAINSQFADLLAGGRFVLSAALPEERDEPEIADLPRLVFQFNHRSFGRLRHLIDAINRRKA